MTFKDLVFKHIGLGLGEAILLMYIYIYVTLLMGYKHFKLKD